MVLVLLGILWVFFEMFYVLIGSFYSLLKLGFVQVLYLKVDMFIYSISFKWNYKRFLTSLVQGRVFIFTLLIIW